MIEDKSLDVLADKMAQLRELFPEVISEGKIDFKRLRDVLGDEVAFHNEHYELSWAGKSEARAEIQKTTSATLIPDECGIEAEGCGNIFIEGENLEVLHVLQRSYFGKVKMIYVDPPYNTGNDSFVYPDDYSERQSDYKKRAGITNEEGFLNKQDLWKKNTKESGQFHSVWLSMMYPRLYLARNLLREDGVIFISIDDNEQANLKLLCDEIFGAENFVVQIIWKSRKFTDARAITNVSTDHEYVLVYAKNAEFSVRGIERDESKFSNPDNDPRGLWMSRSILGLATKEQRPNLHFDLLDPITGRIFLANVSTGWRYSQDRMNKLITDKRILFPLKDNGRPREKKFRSEMQAEFIAFRSIIDDIHTADGTIEIREMFGADAFTFPKPHSLIKSLVEQGTDKNDIILDFFAGSGTTAHAVLALNEQDGGNRQFICVQMPETLEENSEAYKAGYRTIADICKARITKVIAKLQAEREAATQNADLFADTAPKQPLGFNSFKIAPSNFKKWRSDTENQDILEQLDLFRHSEKQDSENKNLLVELLLKSGHPLTAKVETTTIDGQELYNVESGSLLLFFDAYNSQVKAFIFHLKPKRVVCLDRVFKNDEALTNFQLNLKDAGIELQII